LDLDMVEERDLHLISNAGAQGRARKQFARSACRWPEVAGGVLALEIPEHLPSSRTSHTTIRRENALLVPYCDDCSQLAILANNLTYLLQFLRGRLSRHGLGQAGERQARRRHGPCQELAPAGEETAIRAGRSDVPTHLIMYVPNVAPIAVL